MRALLLFFAAASLIQTVLVGGASGNSQNTVSISGDTLGGIFLGSLVGGILIFAVFMLANIESPEVLGHPER
ncbi:hypothetical protein DPX39_100091000 [Trypanosoma brucei equiperdum]|uniref:Uncharacterized protein n=1 Tax=Trypanosoma brucei equiperdum TaxID=630700 RepID=A0A3L6KZ42_9TRYP|nr:hypothetical protein DPX39_100091000 [Trypanosoma brucei equiperdum]